MRVCLISSIHPWVNPRLIKEADALAACGHDVFVVTKRVDRWSDERDGQVLAGKPWSARRVGLMRDDPADRWRWFSSAVRAGLALRGYRAFGSARLAEEANYRGFPLVLRAAIDTRAEVFIAHTQGALPIAARAAAHARVGFGFDCEDLLAEEVADGLRDPALRRAILAIERRYLPRAAYVTAASQAMAGYLRDTYGIPMPSVVRNVFPLADLIGVPAPSERPARRSLEMVWLSASIGGGRGLEDALGALARLPSTVRLTIVGRMLPDFAPRCAALIEALGVSARVAVRPVVDSADMLSTLAQFDVGLALETNTCRNKSLTISNKLFLYLQAGLVLAATDTPGQREVVESVPRAGFVYPPGDEAALANHLLPFVVDRRAAVAAQTAAWDAGRARYNWDREREVFLATFESAFAASRAVRIVPVNAPAMAGR
jgi:glycosyltransferase involved in cell wall biosynthesis